jgi:hypothetical protein
MILIAGVALAFTPAIVHGAEPATPRESFQISGGGDLAVLPVRLGDAVYEFVLDTGVGPTVYDVSLRKVLGPVKREVAASTYGRRLEVALFTPPDAFLGMTKLRGTALVAAIDLRPVREFTGYDVRGLVGVDALMNQIVELNFDTGEMRLLDRVGEGAGMLLPLTFGQTGQLYVDADIAGWGRHQFQLDTGLVASGRLAHPVFDAFVTNGSLTRLAHEHFVSLAETRRVRFGTLDAIQIGANTHRELDFSDGGPISALGIAFLSRYVVTFDFPRQTLYLKKGHRFDVPERRNLSGMCLTASEGQVLVDNVAAHGPADEAGVQNKDVILRVGKSDASTIRLHQLRGILSAAGTEAELFIRRGADTLTAHLKLRDWRNYER